MVSILVDIRPARPDDLDDVRSCAKAAYVKYIESMNKVPAPMVADFARQIELGQVYTAHSRSRLVGYVVFYPQADHLHVENVAVIPEAAGQGIGKQLMKFAEQAARTKDLPFVELYTNEMMTENILLYPRLGYVETERKRQDGFNRVFFRKSVGKSWAHPSAHS